MVWITVVGAGVWTGAGAGAEGDAHPAIKIVTIRQTPIHIKDLLPII
jgi:hypothetical protein